MIGHISSTATLTAEGC